MYLFKSSWFILSFVLLCLSLNAQTFTNVAPNQNVTAASLNSDNWGSGVSFYDYNNDGWDDLSFAMEQDNQVFYQNNAGTFSLDSFSFYSEEAAKHVLWVDYDNNGVLDVLLTTSGGPIKLFRNDGSFSFSDVTILAGLATSVAENYGASFGDYDKDGDLDLYVCKRNSTGNPLSLNDVNNLYKNNGDGTFTDVSFSSGTDNGLKLSFQGVWLDYDKDSWPDLYVINDRNLFQNALYRNNGDGTFNEVAVTANVEMATDDPMTISVADFDNDEDLDVFVSNTGITNKPHLFENQNDGTFINEAPYYNLELDFASWGGVWLDHDNNGLQDLYLATSSLNPTIPEVRNFFYKNNFPNPFIEDSSVFIGNHIAKSHAVARGDLNNDGFYDLVVQNNSPAMPFLWENSGNVNNFIKITLEGTVSNHFAIGSWISIFIAGNRYTQYTMCGENYLGQNSQHHIIGMGNNSIVDSIHIEYLSGIVDKYYHLPVNQDYLFVEGETLSLIQLELGGINPFCEGDSVTLTAPNLLSYLWSNGDSSRTIKVFNEGGYFLNGVDSSGMLVRSDTIYLERIEPPTINYMVQNPSCFSSMDGKIILDVLNEGQDYTLEWNNGIISDSIVNFYSGLYSYSYVDVFGCMYAEEFNITQPFPLNLQLDIIALTNSNLASVNIIINGGTSPYTILLNGDTASNSIDSLVDGSYLLEVIDLLACYHQYSFEIEAPEDSVISGFSNIGELMEPAVFYNDNLNRIEVKFTALNTEVSSIQCFDLAGRRLIASDDGGHSQGAYRFLYLDSLDFEGLIIVQVSWNGRETYSLLRK